MASMACLKDRERAPELLQNHVRFCTKHAYAFFGIFVNFARMQSSSPLCEDPCLFNLPLSRGAAAASCSFRLSALLPSLNFRLLGVMLWGGAAAASPSLKLPSSLSESDLCLLTALLGRGPTAAFCSSAWSSVSPKFGLQEGEQVKTRCLR